MLHRRPTIGLTMGDPAGVGPELVLRAIQSPEWPSVCRLAVFGNWPILQACCRHLGWAVPNARVLPLESLRGTQGLSFEDPVTIVDHPILELKDFEVGKVSRQCGELAFCQIQSSIEAALAGVVDAVATGPINKLSLQAAGHNYPGHTEIFAERAASDEHWCMMQYSPTITCTFVTVHCGYAQVPELLSVERILNTILLTHHALKQIRNKQPKLMVCGLNPHAGESGLFGNREEERFIEPAIQAARQRGVTVEGPLPPDTVFIPSRLAECDAVVCMYHDQGHIPVKALAFESAVNTTLGLSVIRTSVDHGTAFDIAWTGKAKPDSLYAAIRLAIAQVHRSSES
jgi:4-hydroxythreonine-4-phosphate dehydrogenase